MSYDPIADTEINPGKPPKSSIFYRLRDNADEAKIAAENGILEFDSFGPGAFSWPKPAGYQDDDTVLIRAWAGGGAGGGGVGNTGGGGGQGGGFIERAYRYGDISGNLTGTVGAGGAAVVANVVGNSGGDTTVTGTGVYMIAKGGAGGINSSGGTATTGGKFGLVAGALMSFVGYEGGFGAEGANNAADDGDVGGNAIWGGAGGGGAYGGSVGSDPGAGGVSVYGGNGGTGVDSTAPATAGATPAGGGGGGILGLSSGAGGNGLLEIRVLRGWHPNVFSNGY